MIVFGLGVQFWTTPKEGVLESEIAAANVARMEASVAGSSSSKTAAKPSGAKFVEEFKNAQEQQARYATIILIFLGVGFLGYSFIKKKEPEI